MISSKGRGSWSEYRSVTYSCSPERESNLDPSQHSEVDRKVSEGWISMALVSTYLSSIDRRGRTVARDTEMLHTARSAPWSGSG